MCPTLGHDTTSIGVSLLHNQFSLDRLKYFCYLPVFVSLLLFIHKFVLIHRLLLYQFVSLTLCWQHSLFWKSTIILHLQRLKCKSLCCFIQHVLGIGLNREVPIVVCLREHWWFIVFFSPFNLPTYYLYTHVTANKCASFWLTVYSQSNNILLLTLILS